MIYLLYALEVVRGLRTIEQVPEPMRPVVEKAIRDLKARKK